MAFVNIPTYRLMNDDNWHQLPCMLSFPSWEVPAGSVAVAFDIGNHCALRFCANSVSPAHNIHAMSGRSILLICLSVELNSDTVQAERFQCALGLGCHL